MANSSGVTKHLLDRLLKAQDRRAKRESRLPFAEKLRILDGLMAEGPPKVDEGDEKRVSEEEEA